jgi:hypothetical protein
MMFLTMSQISHVVGAGCTPRFSRQGSTAGFPRIRTTYYYVHANENSTTKHRVFNSLFSTERHRIIVGFPQEI